MTWSATNNIRILIGMTFVDLLLENAIFVVVIVYDTFFPSFNAHLGSNSQKCTNEKNISHLQI
jgi:hypothetical protein